MVTSNRATVTVFVTVVTLIFDLLTSGSMRAMSLILQGSFLEQE